MNQISFSYIPLTFINSPQEIKKQIQNTIVFSYLLRKYKNTQNLSQLTESTQYGYNSPASDSGKNKYLRISDIKDGKVNWESVPFCDCNEEEKYKLKKDDILIARTGGTTGKSFLITNAPTNAIFAGYLIRIRLNQDYDPRFIYAFLNSYMYWSQIAELKMGTAQPNVNAEKLKSLVIPTCPKDIQQQIIKLLYEGSTNTFLKDLDNLISTTINKYEKYQECDQLHKIQLEKLSFLNQAIIQDAMRGELATQENHDEPITIVVDKFRKRKQILIKQGELKNDKTYSLDTQHNLPKGWMWCSLTDILDLSNASLRRGPFGSSITKAMFTSKSESTIKIYEQKNAIYKNYELGNYYIDISKYPNLKSFIVEPGDIIISCAGTIGKLYLLPDSAPKGIINQALLKIKLNNEIILNEYFIYYFETVIKDQLNSDSKGSAMKNLGSIKYLKEKLKIPVPPLNEQKRIVNKIDLVIKNSSELEDTLKTSQNNVNLLLHAVLKESFSN